jgi:hypothetical protein
MIFRPKEKSPILKAGLLKLPKFPLVSRNSILTIRTPWENMFGGSLNLAVGIL